MLKKKNIVVIGCSNLGAYIASRLSELGNNVTIIDKNKNSFRILDESYTGFKLEGNGMDRDFLVKNHVDQADIVLVATEDDNTNSCIAQIVKVIYNVPIVITRIYDIDKTIVLEGTGVRIIYPSILVSNEFFTLVKEEEDKKIKESKTK